MAPAVFKTVCDLTFVGLGGFDSHALPPIHVDSPSTMMSSFAMSNVRRGLAAAVLLGAAVPAVAHGQRPDTTVGPIRSLAAVPPDSLRPPIGPLRAFIYSFLVPGSAQAILGRHKAAAVYLLIDGICLSMIRESAADVHEARRTAGDSVIVSYVDANGNPLVTSFPPRFTSKEIDTREAHVEDWAALMVGNHLFSGADAFVSSHLWDVPVHVGMRVIPSQHAFVVGVWLRR